MARLARVIAPGMPHHVTQRGNPDSRRSSVRKTTSTPEHIEQFCRAEQVAIWAYCFMPNHVRLIVVPQPAESLRRGIGEAHRRYTRWINFREGWRGHLWQGRFALFVMDEDHLLTAARYVELDPMHTGWSRHQDENFLALLEQNLGRILRRQNKRVTTERPHPAGGSCPREEARKGEVDSDSLFRVFRSIPWLISDPVDALTAPGLFAVRSDSSRKPRWPAGEAPTRGRRGTGRGAPAEGQTRRRFRARDDQTVKGEENAHKEPDRETRAGCHVVNPHQKITLSAMNTAPTTPAQKIGRCQRGTCCSEGIGVQP